VKTVVYPHLVAPGQAGFAEQAYTAPVSVSYGYPSDCTQVAPIIVPYGIKDIYIIMIGLYIPYSECKLFNFVSQIEIFCKKQF
jgi:hypothetical protein